MTDRGPVVGVLGGGQLGRMLALAGVPLGVRCLCVEPGDDPPAAAAAEVLAEPYGDWSALATLARRCDVVTVELEHVPVEALTWLAERVAVRPSPASVAVAQDRLAEKQALQAAGISTAPFGEPHEVPDGFPGGTLVKVRTGGYDGRGQVLVAPGGDVAAAAAALARPAIAEEVLAFERELSIVAARGLDGEVRSWPLVENRHRDGILRETIAPAPAAGHLQAAADDLVTRLLQRWDYVGVLAVELFEVDGRLLANEVAPRVHNSGHWTIDGAVTSQFEQHLRAILGWPLGDPSPLGPAAMVNVIGTEVDVKAVLAVPGAHLHWYSKAPRPGRKVGHVSIVAESEAARDERLAAVRAIVRDVG